MTKYTIKYIVFVLIINLLLGVLSFLFSQIQGDTVNNKSNIIVFIEAGYNVSEGWEYKAERTVRKIRQKHQNATITVYYFNQTYEIIPQNIKGETEFSTVSPYGDVDYSLLKNFEKKYNKKIDYTIGTEKLKSNKGNSRFLYLK